MFSQLNRQYMANIAKYPKKSVLWVHVRSRQNTTFLEMSSVWRKRKKSLYIYVIYYSIFIYKICNDLTGVFSIFIYLYIYNNLINFIFNLDISQSCSCEWLAFIARMFKCDISKDSWQEHLYHNIFRSIEMNCLYLYNL